MNMEQVIHRIFPYKLFQRADFSEYGTGDSQKGRCFTKKVFKQPQNL